MGLSVSHDKVPKDLYPIILAYGHIIGQNKLHLDMRLFTRGARILEFIDKHIARSALKAIHAATYNRLREITPETKEEISKMNYDEIFFRQRHENY